MIKKLIYELTKFEGVSCSGFFIPDQAMVTALALLFEKIHFLNNLEYVIELSKKYKIDIPGESDYLNGYKLEAMDPDDNTDPLSDLTPSQKRTVLSYIYLSEGFFWRNARLFPDIFHCSLLPKGEVISVKLIKKGRRGELNKYRVRRNPLIVATETTGEFNKLLKDGKIPIVGGIVPIKSPTYTGFPTTQIASQLAIKSVAMVIPGTKAAESDDIFEARDRLKDQLPPFWSSMLKLSADLSNRLNHKSGEEDLQKEVDYAVNTLVRPALIDLVNKLELERSLWFHKILSPLAKGIRVLAGKPPSDLAGLISTSLAVGTEIGVDIARQLRKVEALKQETGLIYLIELYKLLS